MKESNIYRWTGACGVVLFILVMIEIYLYFNHSGPPPVQTIMTRLLVDMFVCFGLVGFFSGFKHIISQLNHNLEFISTFIFGIGIAFPIVLLIANSIQAGSVWAANATTIDPTVVGNGAEGALLIYGPINRLLIAAILFASGISIKRTTIFPGWTAWLAHICGTINLFFVPTIYFMSEPSNFYSTNGWNIPVASGFFFLWILIMSIFLIRYKI